MTAPLLTVNALGVRTIGNPPRDVLSDLSFTLAAGTSVGLVGRSGAGKTTLGNALLGLLPRGLSLTPTAQLTLGDTDLRSLDADGMRRVRGRRLAMVFQEPLLALDPTMHIGAQLRGVLVAHGIARGAEAEERVHAMLARVGIGDPRASARRYPHELSGGMRQRLLLAIALLLEPDVIIADEPTTALDVTLQTQLLDLLDDLRAASGTALLFISHDLALVAERTERVLVLDHGRLIEDGPSASILHAHRIAPRPRGRHLTPTTDPLVVGEGLAVEFAAPSRGRTRPSGVVHAVDGVDLSIAAGECVGLVGESGCGKSTLARTLLGLIPPTRGRARFHGRDLASCSAADLRALRKRMQLVPQDAGASLTPERTVGSLIEEALEVHDVASGSDAVRRARELLAEVGLDPAFAERYPGSLSSGERQRVAIARALAPNPEFLVCDEPVANVDATAREPLLALLDRLRAERGLAMLLIAHDLSVVRRLASRIAVMYLGRVVERAPLEVALDNPQMPYTQMLRAAVPTGDPARPRPHLVGDFPSPLAPPSGCTFHPRCTHPLKDDQCRRESPVLRPLDPGSPEHVVACWKVPLPPSP